MTDVMTDEERQQELQELFIQTQKAHHQAYYEADGFDLDWPIWYAQYAREPLSALLDADFTVSELTYLFVLVDKTLAREAPGAEWSSFYARFFLTRYGGARYGG